MARRWLAVFQPCNSVRTASWKRHMPTLRVAGLSACAALVFGCATGNRATQTTATPANVNPPAKSLDRSPISLVAHQDGSAVGESRQLSAEYSSRGKPRAAIAELATTVESLSQLEALALELNPNLRRLNQQVAAAQARSRYVDKLPDPTVGANIFGHPIETAAGSQRANISVKQMIPWLSRLDAQSQQACFEALTLRQDFGVERLKVIGDVRSLWYRLYVLGKQIETSRANQELLESLTEVANARVATGNASQGDVLLGTLELSKLEEQILTFEQQVVSNKAELNRIVGRDADHPIDVPRQLTASLPEWSHPMLRQVAQERQPAIAAAQLRTQAARWGVEVARLKRRPDVSLSANWFAIDDNRPRPSVVDVGRDAWSIGAQVSVPLWRKKYDAIEQEARWNYFATHASTEVVQQRYDSLLLDLWEQAKTADETSKLYRETILPQARQTLQADQQSYVNGTVEFDRVVRDFRNILTLELGDHRAIGQLRTALARIQQAVGADLPSSQPDTLPLPAPVPSDEFNGQTR